MFTGLVQAVGTVATLGEKGDLVELTVESPDLVPDLGIGDSVAVSGVCLTVTGVAPCRFRVEVAQETLRRTTLGTREVGEGVNLELPLRADDRLGGHFVQGHVDEVGHVRFAGARDGDTVIRVEHSAEARGLVVEKGSIAIDGVSLTVMGCGDAWLEVMLIPHTLDSTTLSRLQPGDGVNLEYDILAKYMARFAAPYVESWGRGPRGA